MAPNPPGKITVDFSTPDGAINSIKEVVLAAHAKFGAALCKNRHISGIVADSFLDDIGDSLGFTTLNVDGEATCAYCGASGTPHSALQAAKHPSPPASPQAERRQEVRPSVPSSHTFDDAAIHIPGKRKREAGDTSDVENEEQQEEMQATLLPIITCLLGSLEVLQERPSAIIESIRKALHTRCTQYKIRQAFTPRDRRLPELAYHGRESDDFRINFDLDTPKGMTSTLLKAWNVAPAEGGPSNIEAALRLFFSWNTGLALESTHYPAVPSAPKPAQPGSFSSTLEVLERTDGMTLDLSGHPNFKSCQTIFNAVKARVENKHPGSTLLQHVKNPDGRRPQKRTKLNSADPALPEQLPPRVRFSLCAPEPGAVQHNFYLTLLQAASETSDVRRIEALLEREVYRLAKYSPAAFPELWPEACSSNAPAHTFGAPSNFGALSSNFGAPSNAAAQRSITTSRPPHILGSATSIVDLLLGPGFSQNFTAHGRTSLVSRLSARVSQYNHHAKLDDRPKLIVRGRTSLHFRIDFIPGSRERANLETRLRHPLSAKLGAASRETCERILQHLVAWNPELFPEVTTPAGDYGIPGPQGFQSTLDILGYKIPKDLRPKHRQKVCRGIYLVIRKPNLSR